METLTFSQVNFVEGTDGGDFIDLTGDTPVIMSTDFVENAPAVGGVDTLTGEQMRGNPAIPARSSWAMPAVLGKISPPASPSQFRLSSPSRWGGKSRHCIRPSYCTHHGAGRGSNTDHSSFKHPIGWSV